MRHSLIQNAAPIKFMNKKIIPYLVGFIISLQAIIPPLELSINFTNSPMRFVWTFLFCGILAFYVIFTKANIFLKILIPYLFLNSFLSRIPHLSMSSFIWAVIGIYFYLLCLEIEDWKPIFRFAWCILILELFLFALQRFSKDTLLNFGQDVAKIACIGSVGNSMQFKSLIIILTAFLIQSIRPKKKYVLAACFILIPITLYYYISHYAWQNFLYARWSVWMKSLELSFKHPIFGNGIGTFKAIFPTLAHGHFEAEGMWTNPHNIFVEFLFETGMIGFLTITSYAVYMLSKIRKHLLLGGLLILYTLCLHFPFFQDSGSLLLMAFLAYSDKELKKARKLWQVPDLSSMK